MLLSQTAIPIEMKGTARPVQVLIK